MPTLFYIPQKSWEAEVLASPPPFLFTHPELPSLSHRGQQLCGLDPCRTQASVYDPYSSVHPYSTFLQFLNTYTHRYHDTGGLFSNTLDLLGFLVTTGVTQALLQGGLRWVVGTILLF